MKIKEWVLTVLSIFFGVALGRWFLRIKPETLPSFSLRVSLPTNSNQPKLKREDVIRLIQENGSSEGLDLSAYDLSGANLRNLNLRRAVFTTYEFWGKPHQSANLAGVNFSDTNLSQANLAFTNLQDSSFWQANLYEASLLGAQAQGASFTRADMRRVTLYASRLDGASFWRTQLEGANLGAARFANALMTEIHLGDALIQEQEKAYDEYFRRWYVADLDDKYRVRHLAARYQQAAEIYMNLKNAFLSNGRYREASWAYLKERQMRRATFAPWRVKTYYGQAVMQDSGFLRWRMVWLYLKFTWLWLFDWANGLTSGYGEKPLRALWWALVVILIFPAFYNASGQIVLANNQPLTWIDYLNYSFGAFTTIGFARFETIGWLAEALTSLEAMLGISVLALLMFALGNRISRS